VHVLGEQFDHRSLRDGGDRHSCKRKSCTSLVNRDTQAGGEAEGRPCCHCSPSGDKRLKGILRSHRPHEGRAWGVLGELASELLSLCYLM